MHEVIVLNYTMIQIFLIHNYFNYLFFVRTCFKVAFQQADQLIVAAQNFYFLIRQGVQSIL